MTNNILQEDIDLTGFARADGQRVSEARVAEILALRDRAAVLSPGVRHMKIEEAVTSADFPILTQYITQRELVARYRTAIPAWLPIVKTTRSRSFTLAEETWTTGIPDILPEQAEGQERHEVYQSELKMRRGLKKYGAKYRVTFESLINDELGALQDIPQQFATAARASEAYRIAELLVDSSGLKSTLFGDTVQAPVYDADGTLITDTTINPQVDNVLDASHDALSITNLKVAIKQLAGMEDPKGRTMSLRAKYLIIPPALELTALEILSSTQVAYAATASGAVPLPTANVVGNYGLQLVVNEFLPVVNTTSGDTQWFLAPDASQGSALRMNYLQGMEDPQIFMKASNKTSVGGSSLGRFAGDFDTDDMQFAVRHIFKASSADPRYIIGSTGDTA